MLTLFLQPVFTPSDTFRCGELFSLNYTDNSRLDSCLGGNFSLTSTTTSKSSDICNTTPRLPMTPDPGCPVTWAVEDNAYDTATAFVTNISTSNQHSSKMPDLTAGSLHVITVCLISFHGATGEERSIDDYVKVIPQWYTGVDEHYNREEYDIYVPCFRFSSLPN